MRNTIGLLCAALLLGCMGWFQSEQAGFEAFCNAQSTCPDCSEAPADQRAQMLAKHIESIVHNTDALRVFEALAIADPAHRGDLLREGARQAGVDTCKLADLWDTEAKALAARSLCELSSRCKSFDKTNLDTLTGCLSSIAPLASKEVKRMPHDNPAAFARSVESWARSNGQDSCQLVHDLRTP